MSQNIKAKLGLNVYKPDPETHIAVDHSVCRAKCEAKYCAFVCPAQVYTLGADGMVQVEHDGCLECGTCVIACPHGALSWRYPRQGHGVMYRFG